MCIIHSDKRIHNIAIATSNSHRWRDYIPHEKRHDIIPVITYLCIRTFESWRNHEFVLIPSE